MRIRTLMCAWTLAVLVSTPGLAQEEQAAHRERSWEFSLGGGMLFLDGALRDFLGAGPTNVRFANSTSPGSGAPIVVARVGFNFTRNVGFSVSGAGAFGSGMTHVSPSADLTYTVNLNANTSPFLLIGTHLTRIDGENDRTTHSTWGAQAGAGIRRMLGERTALRLEGRMRFEHYRENPMSKHTVYNPVATIGFSRFVGGRQPVAEAIVAAAPCPTCPRAVARVDTFRVYVPFPTPAPAAIVLRDTLVLEGVNFAFDESTLTPESHRILDRVAQALLESQWSSVRFEVAGHTSAVGTTAYNVALSQRRAEAVRAYLVSRGVQDARIVARGYGETQPIYPNDQEGRAWQNRRVELRRMR